MERRQHPRVLLPVEIDLRHPFIGTRTVVARDLNDDGVFAWYPDAPFKVGSSMDVTLRCQPMIESSPTPTVKMTVSRVDDDGIVLSFASKSGAHLWRSADQTPQELEIGTDLFRVFQAAVVRDPAGRILTVQQNGRWLYPGCYLQTGEHWLTALQALLGSALNLTDATFMRTVLTHNDPEIVAKESSTMSVFHLFTLDASTNGEPAKRTGKVSCVKATLADDAPYTKVRWLDGHRQLDELSFSAEPLRELARSLIRTGDTRRVAKSAPHTVSETQDSEGVLLKHG